MAVLSPPRPSQTNKVSETVQQQEWLNDCVPTPWRVDPLYPSNSGALYGFHPLYMASTKFIIIGKS